MGIDRPKIKQNKHLKCSCHQVHRQPIIISLFGKNGPEADKANIQILSILEHPIALLEKVDETLSKRTADETCFDLD